MKYFTGCTVQISMPPKCGLGKIEIGEFIEDKLPGIEISFSESDEIKRPTVMEFWIPETHLLYGFNEEEAHNSASTQSAALQCELDALNLNS